MINSKLNLIKKKTLYKTLLGFLLKKGCKISAQRTLDKCFSKILKDIGYSTELSLLKVFLRLNSFVEVKKIKIRRRTIWIPFSLKMRRRSYLAIKWLMEAAEKNSSKTPLFKKLSFEIIRILSQHSVSKASKQHKENILISIQNRSNIHYRW